MDERANSAYYGREYNDNCFQSVGRMWVALNVALDDPLDTLLFLFILYDLGSSLAQSTPTRITVTLVLHHSFFFQLSNYKTEKGYQYQSATSVNSPVFQGCMMNLLNLAVQ